MLKVNYRRRHNFFFLISNTSYPSHNWIIILIQLITLKNDWICQNGKKNVMDQWILNSK